MNHKTTVYGIAIYSYNGHSPAQELLQTAFWNLAAASNAARQRAENYTNSRDGFEIREKVISPDYLSVFGIYDMRINRTSSKCVRKYVVRKITILGSPLTALAGQAE